MGPAAHRSDGHVRSGNPYDYQLNVKKFATFQRGTASSFSGKKVVGMGWFRALSKFFTRSSEDPKECARCMFWTPIREAAGACCCRNIRSSCYDSTTPADSSCDEFVRFGSGYGPYR